MTVSDSTREMLAQAEKLQEQLLAAQREIAEQEISGSAGGGAVTVTAAGDGSEVRSVSIDPELLSAGDRETLEETVTAAVNDVLRRSKELQEETVGNATGGMDLPPGVA